MLTIFFITVHSIRYYAHADDAAHARRIFARSLDTEVSIEAVKRFTGDPATIGCAGYDEAVRAKPVRASESREFKAMHKESFFDWAFNRRNARATAQMQRIFVI